jgi:hypothetical protein
MPIQMPTTMPVMPIPFCFQLKVDPPFPHNVHVLTTIKINAGILIRAKKKR